jgi:hypothetical protein
MKKPIIDPYAAFIDDNSDIIERAFRDFSKIDPIVECDIDAGKIYAYAGIEYIEILSERTRQETMNQFLDLKSKCKRMIFVRDSTNNILRSYIYRKRKEGL